MLEGIRKKTMVRHSKRCDISSTWPKHPVTEDLTKKLKFINGKANQCQVTHSTDAIYEVSDAFNNIPVNLETKDCTCKRWQISGYPCKHAFKAIQCHDSDMMDYISPYMTVKPYRAQYADNIGPVSDQLYWPLGDYPCLQPSVIERKIGRPTKNMRKESGEARTSARSKSLACSKCSNHGHNRRSCQGGLTTKEAKAQAATSSSATPSTANDSAATNAKRKGKAKLGETSDPPAKNTRRR